MKLKYFMLCISMVLLVACHSQTPVDFVDRTNELVKNAYEMGIFSGSVGIAQNGKLVSVKHFGYADWKSKRSFNQNTLFDIASFNKDYTKEMINQLVKEGKIALDDPLKKHLKLFENEDDEKITIHQLLQMTSGLGDYLQAPGFAEREKAGNLTLQDRLNVIKTQPLLFEPGKGEEYSNSGYVVLGAVIEKVTGKSYHQNLKERILQPVGLTQTFYTKEEIRNRPERAIGTDMDFKGEKSAIDDVWSDASPDGGIYASMNDLLRFMNSFYEGELPSEIKYPKVPLAGGSNYWNTVVVPFKDSTTVLIMSNITNIADQLGRRIYDIGNGKSPEPLEMPKEMLLYKNLQEKGIDYIEKNIKTIVKDFDLPYDDRFLNYFGYRFMNGGDVDAAVSLFQLNTELFPKLANVYDSLAEGWLKKGNREKAKELYKKALEIDPNFNNAKQMLDKINSGSGT